MRAAAMFLSDRVFFAMSACAGWCRFVSVLSHQTDCRVVCADASHKCRVLWSGDY